MTRRNLTTFFLVLHSAWLLMHDLFLASKLLRLLRATARETQPLPLRPVTLSEPFAGLDKLDHVDQLLAEHNRERGDAEDPRNGRVHFVSPNSSY